ncbi:Hypothetical predicted protein [Octopus vulgaris]|uniref:Uncharacterized protein n=1 Tax=Octopus vulgaris TaxID=6645 RepID=A0AA36AVX3_OCTVU|nr:Hypothetical predicted protein [Octopus vulgaris]
MTIGSYKRKTFVQCFEPPIRNKIHVNAELTSELHFHTISVIWDTDILRPSQAISGKFNCGLSDLLAIIDVGFQASNQIGPVKRSDLHQTSDVGLLTL